MKLSVLLARLTYEVLQGTKEAEISKVTNDTREVEKGTAFVCIRGYRTDGHKYVKEAVEKGAAALIVKDNNIFPENVTVIRVQDTRYALAVMSAAFYGYPAGKLTMIGVTGTKGKTTTACMIQQMLGLAGHKAGLIGTIRTDTGRRILKNQNTTPESCRIQEYLAEMAEAGCDVAVMEVSSQGLKLGRTAGIIFDVGVFTNLGRDHIGEGEHKDFAEYLQCKHLLFVQSKVGIGNADDPFYEEIFDRTGCRRITYGIKSRRAMDYLADNIRNKRDKDYFGISYNLRFINEDGRPENCEICLPMPGIFNIYNSLAAITTVRYLGMTVKEAAAAIRKVRVPGRMETAALWEDGAVFVDYAHNAMSLENILRMLRAYTSGRVVVVFGCGGGRSRDRRYEMGETAGKYADFSIITTDNPRYEEPEKIIEDIIIGMNKTEGSYVVIPDRRAAVRYAIEKRIPGDMIVIAGKGHETYQEIRGVCYRMDDRLLVKEAVREIGREDVREYHY